MKAFLLIIIFFGKFCFAQSLIDPIESNCVDLINSKPLPVFHLKQFYKGKMTIQIVIDTLYLRPKYKIEFARLYSKATSLILVEKINDTAVGDTDLLNLTFKQVKRDLKHLRFKRHIGPCVNGYWSLPIIID